MQATHYKAYVKIVIDLLKLRGRMARCLEYVCHLVEKESVEIEQVIV